jgi:hypothetical protein
MLYDLCIRPAVQEAIPSQLSHWPVNHKAAMTLARDKSGHFHFGSLGIPPISLVAYCDALIRHLDALPGFENAFFGHELRGLKGGTAHTDEGRHPEEAFDTFFEHMDVDRIDQDNWFVDVGLEIYDPDMVVHWSKHAHSAILGYIMPSLDDAQLRAMQRRPTFRLDNACHLDDFAGFRFDPGQFGRLHDVTYINVYTTDKCPTYQLHAGIWSRRRCEDLFPKKLDKLIEELDTMSKTYKTCAGSMGNSPQEGCARLEIRVPLRRAQEALRNIPQDTITGWTYSVAPIIWW